MTKEKKLIKTQKGKAGAAEAEKESGSNIIAALDVGSSKVCCFIAEIKNHGTVEVIGIGHQASRGVKAGTVIDLRAAETSVAHAVESAETMARHRLQGQPIKSVYVNVAGTHTLSHQMAVDVRVSGHPVSDRDIQSALLQGRSAATPGKDDLIHVIPAGFSIDGMRGIENPRNMTGETLRVDITAITGLSTPLRHIAAIAGQNHLEIDGYCSSPYASALSCLTPDEMQLGCTVIDMGGGTTSMAVFLGGKLAYAAAVPVGGIHITNDIARGLTTSLTDAERIKTLYGSAHSLSTDDGAIIDVPPIGEEDHVQPNHVPISLLTGIIQPRVEETFELVRGKLTDSGLYQAAGRRVVLTGGASQLQGLCEIGQLVLDKQIRLGRPQRVRGLAEATGGPSFAAAAGILLYAAERGQEMPGVQAKAALAGEGAFGGHFLQKVTHWLKENW